MATQATLTTQALREALATAGWPLSLADDARRPNVLSTPREFVEALCTSAHVDTLFVLPGGVSLLEQEEALPRELREAVQQQPTVRKMLDSLPDEMLCRLRGRVYLCGGGEEEELKEGSDGERLVSLLDKRDALRQRCAEAGGGGGGGGGGGDDSGEEDGCGEEGGGGGSGSGGGGGGSGSEPRAYLGEVRWGQKYRHPVGGSWVKTLCAVDVKDYVGAGRSDALPYYDRYDEGVFVGGRFSGSPLHVDQIGWSNVGKNFSGRKLLAVWPHGEATADLFRQHCYRLFTPPLQPAEEAALAAACKVALLTPGDVVLFSGANAHMALSVSASLSLTAYESFVNFHPRSVAAFLESGTERQYRECRARARMVEEVKEEVVEAILDLKADLDNGRVSDPLLLAHAPPALQALQRDAFIAGRLKEAARLADAAGEHGGENDGGAPEQQQGRPRKAARLQDASPLGQSAQPADPRGERGDRE